MNASDPSPSLPTARTAAYAALTERVSEYPNLHRMAMDRNGLDSRDGRLAAAIDHQVTVRWLTLQALVEPFLRQRWDGLKPSVRAALLGGAAQIMLMDRIPNHAILHETVDWVKSGDQPRAAGLVNAILRRLCELRGEHITEGDPTSRQILLRSDGSGVRLNRKIFSADPTIQWTQQTSCPLALLKHWQAAFGDLEARRLALHGIAESPLILAARNELRDITEPHNLPGFQVARADYRVGDLLERSPDVVIQDPASAEPVRATIGLGPRLILDLCAGRGTKTRMLAETHPQSQIMAMDIDPGVQTDLINSTQTYGNVEIRPFGDLENILGQVDLLVLDVPCSNTAVIPRRPEARYRFSPESIEDLCQRQRQIMADALPVLAPNAHLLYATCSLDPRENFEQVQWLMRWHRLKLQREHLMIPCGLPGEPPTGYHDGSYHALLAK